LLHALALAVAGCGRGRSDSGSELPPAAPDGWRVVCPLVVARRVFGEGVYSADASVEDGGWMYLDLEHGVGTPGCLVDRLKERAGDHLVFTTDFF
jgi:hypothetical protein